MSTNPFARVAAVLLGLEAVAIAVLVVAQVLALLAGDAGSVETAVALTVLTAVGAAAVAAFAVATWRGQSWGRSGGIVTQALIAAVALGAVTGIYAEPLIGLALAVPAVLTFVALVLASRQAGAGRADLS